MNEKPDYSNWSRAALMELACQQIAEIEAKQERIDELQRDLKLMQRQWRVALSMNSTAAAPPAPLP